MIWLPRRHREQELARKLGITRAHHGLLLGAGGGGGGDPYSGFVVLQMSAVNDDQSGYNHVVTPVAGATTDTSDYFFAPSSCSYPSATGDRSVVTESANLRLDTSDFIAELICKPLATNTALGAFYVKGINSSDGIILAVCTAGATFRANGTDDLPYSTTVSSTAYSYWAFIGEGGTFRRIYYAATPGGTATQVASAAKNYNNNNTGDAAVGNGGSNGFFWTGRLHLRISKGTTRGITGGASFTSPASF